MEGTFLWQLKDFLREKKASLLLFFAEKSWGGGGGGEIRMIYSFRPLPLMKGCRWMTYHLTVHTMIIPMSKKNQQTNDDVLD